MVPLLRGGVTRWRGDRIAARRSRGSPASTATRLGSDLGDDVESRAFLPALVGGALVLGAELVAWLAADNDAPGAVDGLDVAVLVVGVAGLALLAVGVTMAFRFAYRGARRDGHSRPRSIGRSLKHIGRYLFRWMP